MSRSDHVLPGTASPRLANIVSVKSALVTALLMLLLAVAAHLDAEQLHLRHRGQHVHPVRGWNVVPVGRLHSQHDLGRRSGCRLLPPVVHTRRNTCWKRLDREQMPFWPRQSFTTEIGQSLVLKKSSQKMELR